MAFSETITHLVTELERDFGGYQCWVVPLAVGGFIWCARPWTSQRQAHVLNCSSELQLRADLSALTTCTRPAMAGQFVLW